MTLGSSCEVVLHDFRDPAHSIIAIEGDVTHRHVGGSVTQIGLSLIAQGDSAEDQINYVTRSPNGRVLKSSTLLLRDTRGRVFGALCINIDVTDVRLALSTLQEFAGTPISPPSSVTFVDDIGQVIQSMVDEEEISLGRSVGHMTRQDRLAVFRVLERRGVFALRRSVPLVAEALSISRATAYSYLEELRLSTGEQLSRPGVVSRRHHTRNGSGEAVTGRS